MFFSAGSIASSIAQSISFMSFTRFITGIGLTAMLVIVIVYISEMSPSHIEEKIVAITIASGTIGFPVGAAFARWVVPLSTESWRYIFIVGGIAILLIPLCFSCKRNRPVCTYPKDVILMRKK
jgi:putative MFS transporter